MPEPQSPWIVTQPRPGARLRLFCFPYSGGGATVFRGWSDALPGVEVSAIVSPGRETRLREPVVTQLGPLVEACEGEVLRRGDLPFVFYGHSLGAFVAFEVARALRRRGAALPRHLFAGASVAPQVHAVAAPIARGSDAGLIARLRRYGGTPEEVLAEPDLMALLLRPFRADLRIFEDYRASDEPPLDVPITAFAGATDEFAPQERIEGWAAQTSRGFSLRTFPGGHLFLQSSRAALHQAMLADLAPILGA
jgi:medium-chain acyl-[acyl-carrier-protein] hydrolase